jgi:hypothetical protein
MREIICHLTLNVTLGGCSGHTDAKPCPLETHAVAGLPPMDVASPTPSPRVMNIQKDIIIISYLALGP